MEVGHHTVYYSPLEAGGYHDGCRSRKVVDTILFRVCLKSLKGFDSVNGKRFVGIGFPLCYFVVRFPFSVIYRSFIIST